MPRIPPGARFCLHRETITALRTADGFGTRFDTGYQAGDEVSQFYDNLIGKLVVWGKDRPTAIARALRALNETTVEGVATTTAAAVAILEHPDFAAVTHSTKWLERDCRSERCRRHGRPRGRRQRRTQNQARRRR